MGVTTDLRFRKERLRKPCVDGGVSGSLLGRNGTASLPRENIAEGLLARVRDEAARIWNDPAHAWYACDDKQKRAPTRPKRLKVKNTILRAVAEERERKIGSEADGEGA